MPSKILRKIFKQQFGIQTFQLTKEHVFAFETSSISEFSKKARNKRARSRLIAKATMFNFKPIIPLTQIFNVSIEAMAIRLEELGLVE